MVSSEAREQGFAVPADATPPPNGGVSPIRVLLDFDGTLVEPNVAIELVKRFCPDGVRLAEEVDRELHSGQITLREAWARQVASLPPARRTEMVEFVVREVPLRAGARELLELLDAHRVPTAVVSGGLDFFIRPVLDRERIRYPLFADAVEANGNGHWTLRHPYGHPTCRLCGICKASVVFREKPSAPRAVFIGDGSTDRFAAEVADIVFARWRLRQYCERVGIPHFPFEEFGPVTRQLSRWLSGLEPLPPERRRGLWASPCPISSAATLTTAPATPEPLLRD